MKKNRLVIVCGVIFYLLASILQEVRLGYMQVKTMSRNAYVLSGAGIILLHILCLLSIGKLWVTTKKDHRKTANTIAAIAFFVVLFGAIMSVFLVIFPSNNQGTA